MAGKIMAEMTERKTETEMDVNLYGYVSIALLAALGVVFQLLHVGYMSPWGMWIDVVAVPAILALFLFDTEHSLAVAGLIALVIAIGSPAGFVGAIMKFIGTVPMIMVLGFGKEMKKFDISKIPSLLILLTLALVLRVVLTVFSNYYWALPIWLNMTTAEAFQAIPWWIIGGLNVIQGVLEVGIAWILAFKFKLVERYGSKI